MPQQTFWNLPDEKRRNLIDLAVEEFAEHSYQTASISRIVARAGIAKGSLYQYFDDKRDLYLFLLDLSNERRLAFLRDAQPPAEEQGFFEHLRWSLGASIQAALAYPQLARLSMRAYSDTLPFEDEALARAKTLAEEYYRQLIRQGIARGELAPDLDPEVATAALIGVATEASQLLLRRLGVEHAALAQVDVHQFDTPVAHEAFDGIVRVLEHGLGNPARRRAGREP